MSEPMVCERCGQTHDPKHCPRHVDEDDGTLRPCRSYPIRGGTVCSKHGGNAPQVRAKAGKRLAQVRLRAEAARDLTRMGVSIPVEDGDGIRAMRDEAAGNVAVLRRLIQRLDTEVTGLVWNPDREAYEPPQADGIAVRTYHQSGIATGEAKPHVLIVMYNEERDRLAKLDEVCVKLGLDARRLRLVEEQARLVGEAQRRALSRTVPAELLPVVLAALAAELRGLVPEPIEAGSEVR